MYLGNTNDFQVWPIDLISQYEFFLVCCLHSHNFWEFPFKKCFKLDTFSYEVLIKSFFFFRYRKELASYWYK
jgi:hypothetical protein